MKQLRPFLVFLLLIFPLQLRGQNVFYGERAADDSKLALYFDKDGFPYPDYQIPDSSMTKAYGSLFTWFMQNGDDFIVISARYELFPEKIDKETIFRLRDSIIAVNVRAINRQAGNFPAVAFYIHGFRKQFVLRQQGVTSVEEFRLLKENLETYGKPSALEVEVYWDGTYDCCFSAKRKKNQELFRLYETAGKYARAVGLGLRPFLDRVANGNIQIVAHSLGARVATSALFNENGNPGTPTPMQRVSIVLIAPAIDGAATFSNWYDRNSLLDFKRDDNYRLMILYDEKDFVLRKKDPKMGLFGPGTKRFGDTSLGCNRNDEATKLKAYFAENYLNSEIVLVDKTAAIGKQHSLRCYTTGDNLKEVSDFLWKPLGN